MVSELYNTAVNDFDAEKSRCSLVLVVTEFVVSGTEFIFSVITLVSMILYKKVSETYLQIYLIWKLLKSYKLTNSE